MTAPVEHSAQLQVPEAGPMFDGHFPGNPILPGARLLDLALATIGAAADEHTPLQVHVAKFLAPVPPGAVLRLDWRVRPDGRIAFECYDGERRVAQGTLSRLARSGASTQGPSR